MLEICLSALDALEKPVSGPLVDADSAALVSLHREVLETIRLTIASCAHPSCASCHELGAALDRYLIV